MQKKPRISILLATYNGQEFIAKQLDSIENQIDVSISIIVSDDASEDNTQEVLRSSINKKTDISILPAKKTGNACKNFFRLINDTDFSKADFIAFSDQDDIWNNDKLSNAIHLIHKNDAHAYSSNVVAFWPDGQQRLINKAQPQKKYDYMFESAGPGCTFVLSKKLALDLQSFLQTNNQNCKDVALHDWFAYAFARSKGYEWFIDPVPGMLYRQHTQNVMGANSGLKSILARWQKLKEGWYTRQILLLASILNYTNSWPIKRLQRLDFADRLILAANASQLRRRMRDQVAFAFFILFFAKKP
jgi:rhamnosyltransferase